MLNQSMGKGEGGGCHVTLNLSLVELRGSISIPASPRRKKGVFADRHFVFFSKKATETFTFRTQSLAHPQLSFCPFCGMGSSRALAMPGTYVGILSLMMSLRGWSLGFLKFKVERKQRKEVLKQITG